MRAATPALRLIDCSAKEAFESSWFCGHCAAPPAFEDERLERVCRSCGLGLMHQARVDTVPRPDQAFVIIDSALTVQALSSAAEAFLSVNEDEAVNRHVTKLLLPADVETGRRTGGSGLAGAIASAASSDGPASHVFVRPATTFGVRLRARITACGPPRAALLVLGQPQG
jgi:hypothetical protein